MGNPSNATTDVNNPFNYLLPKTAVCHRLSPRPRDSELGVVASRFNLDRLGIRGRMIFVPTIRHCPPVGITSRNSIIRGSGFDRGHHTPSGDRTRSIPDNSATFFMTNMMPQAPGNNQGPWEKLESDSRGHWSGRAMNFISSRPAPAPAAPARTAASPIRLPAAKLPFRPIPGKSFWFCRSATTMWRG